MMFQQCEVSSNCGMKEWTYFDRMPKDPDEVMKKIAAVCLDYDDGDRLNGLAAIVLLSGNKTQARNKSGYDNPHKMAKWLIAQGEKVIETEWAANLRHVPASHIKAYLWKPSVAFRRKIVKLQKDMEKEDNTDRWVW